MIAEKTKQNANYFRIVTILRSLLNSGEISKNEYNRAKAYYKKLTGADMFSKRHKRSWQSSGHR